MKLPAPCAAWLVAGSLLAPVLGAAPPASDAAAARRVLREELATEPAWVKVHAAEVLAAYGEAATVRAVFLEELKLHPDQNQYRIGIHRVLARTAPTPRDRAAEVAWIAQVFIDPAAKDRGHAVETLAKLGPPHSPAVVAAARLWLTHATAEEAVFIQWLLWESGDVSARDSIVSCLRSAEGPVRLRAGYALRLTGTTDPAALAELARAADREPAEGDAATRAIVVGAAYQLQASPPRLAAWREILEKMVADGPPLASFHALQALMNAYGPADLGHLRPLLSSPPGDVRIAAAWAVLCIITRPAAGQMTPR